MKFKTLEISDPAFEPPGFRLITVHSAALKGRADISIYVPETARALTDVPVIVLLHGVYGSHWSWAYRGGVHQVIEQAITKEETLPFVLVMPSDGLWGDGSGYVPHQLQNFEQWISEEVPEAVIQSIDQISNRSRFYISGLSMGGYGAFRVGLTYERYLGISAHSSLTDLIHMGRFTEERWVELCKEVSLTRVTDMLEAAAPAITPFRFDCGIKDPLLGANQVLHDWLVAQNIDHDYDEPLGGHDWHYWRNNITKTFQFFTNLEYPANP